MAGCPGTRKFVTGVYPFFNGITPHSQGQICPLASPTSLSVSSMPLPWGILCGSQPCTKAGRRQLWEREYHKLNAFCFTIESSKSAEEAMQYLAAIAAIIFPRHAHVPGVGSVLFSLSLNKRISNVTIEKVTCTDIEWGQLSYRLGALCICFYSILHFPILSYIVVFDPLYNPVKQARPELWPQMKSQLRKVKSVAKAK